MDNPATDSVAAPLSPEQSASLFAAALSPADEAKEKEQPEATNEPEAAQTPEGESKEPDAAPETEEAPAKDDDPVVTVKINGEDQQVKLSEVIKGYSLNKVSTERFEQASHMKKEAEAQQQKAQAERRQAADGLAQAAAVLTAQLQGQSQINWHELRERDPTEFLRQWHLFNEGNAKLQNVRAQQNQLAAFEAAEAKKALVSHITEQRKALLDKLPEWKDEAKAQSERQAIAKELIDRGFEPARVFGEMDTDGLPKLDNPGLTDHRILLLARDAMLYRQMVSKAKAAADKVGKLPAKVERPSGGETNAGLDRRASAYQRLSRSGKVEDAAALFSQIL